MLDKSQAKAQAELFLRGTTAKACTTYKGLYIFRVEWPMPGEEFWDPFLSVDPLTGETQEFSVVGHITPDEFKALKWEEI